MERVKTFCRICEAHCALEVEVDRASEKIIKVRPDKSHPVSKGYSCIKGVGLGELNQDPSRVNHPLKKVDGEWQRISWDQALEEIGEKVKSIKAEHGARSLAMYAGNPAFFNYKSILYLHDFMPALGSPNLFSSHSIDVNNKLYTAKQIYGYEMVHPIPDFDHTEFILCMGSNPVVSQMSILQLPNSLARLQAIEARGGKVVMVDPRKTETAEKVGDHLYIRPGTDVYLLLAILHHLVETRPLKLEAFEPYANNVDQLIAAAKPWTLARCAKMTGIAEEVIRQLATDYLNAKGAALYMSTGVNMGPFGSLSYWLIQGLSLLSGNLDVRGGMIFGKSALGHIEVSNTESTAAPRPGDRSADKTTLKDGWPKVAACFPSNTLAEEIAIDHPDRIRALFVMAGNPVHSIPGGQLAKQMGRLELVVCIDIYKNETAHYADYVLPATDMLERSDYPISWAKLQPTPNAQFTDPVIAPRFERREEWQILSDLAIACGTPPDGNGTCFAWKGENREQAAAARGNPDNIIAALLAAGGKVTLDQLKENSQGVVLEETTVGDVLGVALPTADKKMQLAPPTIIADLPRLEAYERQQPSAEELLLIGRRDRRSHNSWMHGSPYIKQPDSNKVLMHPADAEARGIVDGQMVVVSGKTGDEITLPVTVEDSIMPGVIAVPHGWGHDGSGVERAAALKGANVNRVIPGGAAHVEPVSGQAIMVAVPVQIRSADTAAC